MTRFLPRIWDDPHCGCLNSDTERLFAYHHTTKHTFHSVRAGARHLDWHNQPDPFRTYEGAPIISLPQNPDFPDAGTFATMAALSTRRNSDFAMVCGQRKENPFDVNWISRFLWHSMAVSAWKIVPGSGARYSLRVNPSSGNLHPTETYLALRGFAGIDDGLYHYCADLHVLELRRSGACAQELGSTLGISAGADCCLIVGLTSIFWREAWKYRERAYRYCCHDLGHALMSLLLSAQALGLSGSVIGDFSDARMVRALAVEGSDEAPMAFLVVRGPAASPAADVAPRTCAGEPNELSWEEVPYELILGMHASSVLPEPPSMAPRAAIVNSPTASDLALRPAPLEQARRDAPLGMIARRRRSALDFDPLTPPMAHDEMEQLLDFATRDWRADWRGNAEDAWDSGEQGAYFVDLYLYVHRVKDCDPGVYRWHRPTRKIEQLHSGNVQRVAAFLSLEQSLAGNSCITISMVADLAAAAQSFGNRGYRYVYFEAGAIGQKLYLGAEALGWNATGIGAFYDDDVHRYLGFLEEGAVPVAKLVREAEKASLIMLGSPASGAVDQDSASLDSAVALSGSDARRLPRQVIYHFAIGRAVLDPRLEAPEK